MACVWARPEPLTELYGAVSFASLAVLGLARIWHNQPPMQEKASMPLLASPTRETWVDSARFVLIVFIVMGHYVAIPCSYIAEQSYWLGPLLAWINLFVMPGFAALSGYLSKGPLTEPRVGRLLIFVLAPYLLSKLVYWMWFSIEFRVVGWFDPFDTYSNSLGLEWYLVVLVQWRLAIALMSPLNKWCLVGFAFAIGLVSGNWVPGNAALALQRACAFFPFFVLGYHLDLALVREIVTRSASCKVFFRMVFVGSLALLFCFPGIARLFMSNTLGDLNFDYASAIPTQLVTGKVWPGGFMPVLQPVPRANCGSEWALSCLHRLVRYELGALLLLGLLAWMPSASGMAWYGKHTMYPYLLHPWIFQLWVMPWMNSHMPTVINSLAAFSAGGYVWIYAVIFAPVLTLALTAAPVRFLTGFLIEPTWLGPLVLSSQGMPKQKPGKTETCGMMPMPKASV